jgi:hypothetical protein
MQLMLFEPDSYWYLCWLMFWYIQLMKLYEAPPCQSRLLSYVEIKTMNCRTFAERLVYYEERF